jgi:hypothetical protein
MDSERRVNRLRDFLLGGLVGASAALAAARRRQMMAERRRQPRGLAAFEDAPCFQETMEREALERLRG